MKKLLGIIMMVGIRAAAFEGVHAVTPGTSGVHPTAPAATREDPDALFQRHVAASPLSAQDVKRVAVLLGREGIDSDDFNTREKASKELGEMGLKLFNSPPFLRLLKAYGKADAFPDVSLEAATRAVLAAGKIRVRYRPITIDEFDKKAKAAVMESEALKTLSAFMNKVRMNEAEQNRLEELLAAKEEKKTVLEDLQNLAIDTQIATIQEGALARAGMEIVSRRSDRKSGFEMSWEVKDTATGKHFAVRSRDQGVSAAEIAPDGPPRNVGVSLRDLGEELKKDSALPAKELFPPGVSARAFQKSSGVCLGGTANWFREPTASYRLVSAPPYNVTGPDRHAPDPDVSQSVNGGWSDGATHTLNYQLYGAPGVPRASTKTPADGGPGMFR